MRIRRAQESDLEQLKALSEAVDTSSHWTPRQWLDVFCAESPARLAWLAEGEVGESSGRVNGFLVALKSGPEWELENIAVLPEFRRQGIGLGLLSALLEEARRELAGRILLEVRASNQAAICFYQANGFELLTRRLDYYRRPTEDALILVRLIFE
jgi:ribosomal protein S18 acetylase RimI-like enzyme